MEPLPGPKVFEWASEAAEFIQRQLRSPITKPAIGVICGSGLGGLSDILASSKQEVEYAGIPHFPQSTVSGHAGKLAIGACGKSQTSVIMMVGRAHFYEGHSVQSVVFPIRVLKLLGVETLIVTNASGALNDTYAVGDLVLINDHLNLAGLSGNHPLRGINADDFGVRFPPLSEAYDLELRRLTHMRFLETVRNGRKLHEGIYAYVSGPSYETRAECRALRTLGADLVGMSTVPEVIVGRHCGIRILAISLVTNCSVTDAGPRGDDPDLQKLSPRELRELSAAGKANHQEVLNEGKDAAQDVQALVRRVLEDLTSN